MIKLPLIQGAFELEITSVDQDPSGQNWFNLKSKASSENFSGWSSFCASQGTILTFLEKLRSFDDSMFGNPKLTCGIGETVLFELEFLITDKLGHVGVKLSLAVEHVTSWGAGNKISLEFDTDIQSVSNFRKDFEVLAYS
ncbi:MAG: hypothetical protein ABIQ95_09880 [Bdellovibrionia bacterium]